jgi:hypothetical protein
VTDYSDIRANIAQTHSMRDLDVITGPCDPELFPGKVATIRRMRADRVERGMTLGSFIWPPFCWPVARPDCLLHLWPVETVTWKPVHSRDWAGRPVYQGQQVTLTFSGDLGPWTGRDKDFVWQVTDLRFTVEGEAS